MQNLLSGLKFTRVKNDATVATSDVESDAVDMSGFDSVVFAVIHGTITDGTPDIHVEQSADSAGSPDTWADLEGSLVAVSDDHDDKITLVEVRRPRERYVRVVVDRAGSTGSVVDAIIAIQGFPRQLPVTQDDTVGNSGIVSSPAEGTP